MCLFINGIKSLTLFFQHSHANDVLSGSSCKEWAPRGTDLCGASSHCSLKATSKEVNSDTCIGISVYPVYCTYIIYCNSRLNTIA